MSCMLSWRSVHPDQLRGCHTHRSCETLSKRTTDQRPSIHLALVLCPLRSSPSVSLENLLSSPLLTCSLPGDSSLTLLLFQSCQLILSQSPRLFLEVQGRASTPEMVLLQVSPLPLPQLPPAPSLPSSCLYRGGHRVPRPDMPWSPSIPASSSAPASQSHLHSPQL